MQKPSPKGYKKHSRQKREQMGSWRSGSAPALQPPFLLLRHALVAKSVDGKIGNGGQKSRRSGVRMPALVAAWGSENPHESILFFP